MSDGRCALCNHSFGMIRMKHMCRLCRSAICEDCSIFKTNVEMQEYRWCEQWLSNQGPSFVSFLLHDTHIRMCNRCGNWDNDRMRAMWKVIGGDWMSLKDVVSLNESNNGYRVLCSVYLQRIRKRQRNALLMNSPLLDRETTYPLMRLKNGVLRDRWRFIVSKQIQMPNISSILNIIELMWKLRRAPFLSQTQKRTLWGILWTNRSSRQMKLLYFLAQQLGLELIPSNLQRQYGTTQRQIDSWCNWIKADDIDIDAIPDVECPLWKQKLDDKKASIRLSVVPSATRPVMMRWDGRGLLWKRESGSVDRLIEYSVAVCSEALREHGILRHHQMWYDVAQLRRDVVAIQIVPNCVSLSKLSEQRKSVLEYICDKNDGMSVSGIRRKLMESIAFSSAVSWFFGYGDRHLDNIMVTDDGCIFHIDFGFCFGREPKIGVPRIRITQDMMNSLGPDYWKQCIQKGQQIMNWMKGNLQTLRVISDFADGESKNHIAKHWKKIEQDTTSFEELAMESIQSWTTGIHDFFHSSAQSFRSLSSLWASITQ